MTRVILESPFAGEVERNIQYARECIRDSLSRGEAPIASHLLYTQKGILNDDDPYERMWGINAGLSWKGVADKHVFYVDYGMSKGMEYGLAYAQENKIPVEFRKLYEDNRQIGEITQLKDLSSLLNKVHWMKDKTENKRILKSIPSKSVDLLLTDPPYKVGKKGLQGGFVHGGENGVSDKYGWVKRDVSWDDERPDKEMFDEMLRVSKHQIIWGGNYFTEYGLPSSQGWLIWDKMQTDFSLADAELAWTSFDKAIRRINYSRAQFRADEPFRKHATQKPLVVIGWCLKQAIDYLDLEEGSIVLDPYSGSGTTAEICLDYKMNYICMELMEENVKNSNERIQRWKDQGRLF